MAADIASIMRLLQGKRKIDVPNDWLEACLAWIQEENESRRMSPAQYEQAVWEQWLVSNLRELSHGCLPPNIAHQQKLELNNGFYSLQVESVVDVSQSFYGQLQKVRGTENENVNVSATQSSKFQKWEPKAGRLLMLKMTDGVQDVQGMEYQPIRGLNTNLTPGTKVQIKGPVLCRRGVMMLRESNICVLGGDVEDLVETNTPDIILETHLQANTNMSDSQGQQQKKQFSPKRQNTHTSHAPVCHGARDTTVVNNLSNRREPTSVNQGSISRESTSANRTSNAASRTTNQTKSASTRVAESQGRNEQNNQNVSLEPIPPACDDSSMDIPDDDLIQHLEFEEHWDQDDDMDIEEMMDSAVADVELQNLPDSAFTELSGTAVVQPSRMSGSKESSDNPMNSTSLRSTNSSLGRPMVDSFVANTSRIESRNKLGIEPVESKVLRRPVVVDLFSPPYTYLSVLNQQYREEGPIRVKVKGYVATMLSRLNNNDGGHWSLTVKINDGTSAVDVDISDQVLTQLIGFTAADSLKLKELGKTDKNAKRKLRDGVAKCQQGLIDMSCIMELEISANSPIHSLRQLFPLNSCHITQLQDRNK